MDYKEEYQKALERAKKGLPIDEVFPELKKIEDERIRSFLYEFIKVCGWSEKQYPPREKCLAYLEKQKEQEPGDEDRYMEGYMNGMNDAIKRAKPAGWSDEDEEQLKGIIELLPNLTNRHAWLCGIKQRLQSLRPQPKQDVLPSLREKQILCLKRALDYLRKEHNRYGGEDFTNEIAVLEWLITHPILVSGTHWKPSEEQMDSLMRTITWLVEKGNHTDSSILADLRRELKKQI